MSDVLKGTCTKCNREIAADEVGAYVKRTVEANISFHPDGGQDEWDSKASGPTELIHMGSDCCYAPVTGMKFEDGDLVADEHQST